MSLQELRISHKKIEKKLGVQLNSNNLIINKIKGDRKNKQ